MPGRLSHRRWQELRAAVLATSDICWLCNQPGADTVDHVVEIANGGAVFDLRNLRPAHGRKRQGCPGNYGRSNREHKTSTSRDW